MKPCKIFTRISPYLISELRRNIYLAFDLHSLETETLNKYVAKCEMDGRISQQVSGSWHENSDNSIRIAKP